jgi:hypothetical protein
LLFIFPPFFDPLFSLAFRPYFFNFHLHVMLLPSLFFFLSMFLWSIPFFTLSGCAYHWSSTITRFRG